MIATLSEHQPTVITRRIPLTHLHYRNRPYDLHYELWPGNTAFRPAAPTWSVSLSFNLLQGVSSFTPVMCVLAYVKMENLTDYCPPKFHICISWRLYRCYFYHNSLPEILMNLKFMETNLRLPTMPSRVRLCQFGYSDGSTNW